MHLLILFLVRNGMEMSWYYLAFYSKLGDTILKEHKRHKEEPELQLSVGVKKITLAATSI